MPTSPSQATPLVRIHIVDDDSLFRSALANQASKLGAYMEHGSAEEFLAAYDDQAASCLLLDLSLPGMCGLELLTELRDHGRMLPTLVLSGNASVERVVLSIQRGAVGFLQKPFEPQQLRDHLEKMIDQAMPMMRQRERASFLARALATLTPREREAFHMMLAGRSAKQMAMDLGLRGRTVHIYRANVLRKLRVDSILELVQTYGSMPIASAPS